MNFVMKVPHVIQKKDTYHFRYSIPADCRESFGGRSEIQKSLKTNEILEAKERSEKLTKIWKDKIAKVRATSVLKETPASSRVLDLNAIAEEFRKSIAPSVCKRIHACLPPAPLKRTVPFQQNGSFRAP